MQLLSLFLSGALFLLPVLIAFASKVSLRNRRAAVFLAWGVLLWSLLLPSSPFITRMTVLTSSSRHSGAIT